MSFPPEQSLWERAARALRAGDMEALDAACALLPAPTVRMLAEAAARPNGSSVPPAGLPEGVEWIGDGRFAAFFARRSVVFHWEKPGRELVTGCYFAPGGRAEFRLEAGECRFVVLQREKLHA